MNRRGLMFNCILLISVLLMLTACCFDNNSKNASQTSEGEASVQTTQNKSENNDRKGRTGKKASDTDDKRKSNKNDIEQDISGRDTSELITATPEITKRTGGSSNTKSSKKVSDKSNTESSQNINTQKGNDGKDTDQSPYDGGETPDSDVPTPSKVTPAVVADDTRETFTGDVIINDDGTVELPFVAVE